jgi:hypothetical protein
MDHIHDREINDFLLWAKNELPNASQTARNKFIYRMCINYTELSPAELDHAMIQKLYGRVKWALRQKDIVYIRKLYNHKDIWRKLGYL